MLSERENKALKRYNELMDVAVGDWPESEWGQHLTEEQTKELILLEVELGL